MKNFVIKELSNKQISIPDGKINIVKDSQHWKVKWKGKDVSIVLESTASPLIVNLTVKTPTIFKKLNRLHKAAGGIGFKIYATFFASALMLILLSGFLMAWQMPKYRKLTLTSSLLGIVLFIVMVILN